MKRDRIPRAFEYLQNLLLQPQDIYEIDHQDSNIISEFLPESICKELTTDIINCEHHIAISFEIFKDLYTHSTQITKKYRNIINYSSTYMIYDFTVNDLMLYERPERNIYKFGLDKELLNIKEGGFCMETKFIKEVGVAAKILLILNGENYTSLNIVREIYQITNILNPDDILDHFQQEIAFISLVNLKFRKSCISWGYRKYIIENIINKLMGEEEIIIIELNNRILTHEDLDKILCTDDEANINPNKIQNMSTLILNELHFFHKCNEHSPRNYYAWQHLGYIFSLSAKYCSPKLIKLEVYFTLRIFYSNDATAVHYLRCILEIYQKLIPNREREELYLNILENIRKMRQVLDIKLPINIHIVMSLINDN